MVTEVAVNKVNPKISATFYNNERSRRFRVVAEGKIIFASGVESFMI
jgi:hypothetical protein